MRMVACLFLFVFFEMSVIHYGVEDETFYSICQNTGESPTVELCVQELLTSMIVKADVMCCQLLDTETL